MNVTFIAHSAFLVEWDKFYTLFDYTYEPDYTGALPELSGDKPLLVFSSHSHEDHFDAKVFTLLEKYPGARFFVSRDTRLTERKRQCSTFPMQPLPARPFCGPTAFCSPMSRART